MEKRYELVETTRVDQRGRTNKVLAYNRQDRIVMRTKYVDGVLRQCDIILKNGKRYHELYRLNGNLTRRGLFNRRFKVALWAYQGMSEIKHFRYYL